MRKIGLVIHGGASDETDFIKTHPKEIKEGLEEALIQGYKILSDGGPALAAVQEAVIFLENNPHFNAGRGSALNCKGEVEMDASIMDGKTGKAGAVSMVRSIKNPVILAKHVMDKTNHVFLSGYGALDFAKSSEFILEPDAYFITEHQYDDFVVLNREENLQRILKKRILGTVGAVALDSEGNLAAATSTGGTSNCLPGRIGDSCVIGAGCYARNNNCAVSGTGDGEVLITNVIANTISMVLEFKKISLQRACDYVIQKRKRAVLGSIGVISLDANANIGISFTSEIMKRGWITSDKKLAVKIKR